MCGRRVTRGWSDHAVNGDSISQEALQEQLKHSQELLSRWHGGLRRFGQRSQELRGRFVEFMVDAGVQVFVDWMVLVHRRIVGRWICQRIEPNTLVTVMPDMEGSDV